MRRSRAENRTPGGNPARETCGSRGGEWKWVESQDLAGPGSEGGLPVWGNPMTDPPASSRGAWILAATILGSSLAFIDGTVVNVALPALKHDLGAGVTEV